MNYFKCGWCGKFIAYDDKDAITYTNYGSYPATEPPDAINVCGKCWKACKRKKFYKNSEYIWYPATKLFRRS